KRPFYALQDPRINDPSLTLTTIAEVATEYLKGIKEIQPLGPYILGGHSYGGIVAFEMAKQLQDNGEQIKLVVMLDSWAAFPDSLRDKISFKNIMQQQQELLKSQLSSNITIPNPDAWLDLQWDRMQSLYDYQPDSKLNLPVALFKATELYPENVSIDDPHNHWQQYNNMPIITVNVPGNHDNMHMEPNTKELAEQLQQLLTDFDP
ncbi:MAG: alpha/beta fold hydrolase, partial [Gammaproteobacteria bacterium]|nr:alpha/beta fold hydrolase [Gammaproteobacteria bacterium]